jgi:hypothetical protein
MILNVKWLPAEKTNSKSQPICSKFEYPKLRKGGYKVLHIHVKSRCIFRMLKRELAPNLFFPIVTNWSKILTTTITYLDKAPNLEYQHDFENHQHLLQASEV